MESSHSLSQSNAFFAKIIKGIKIGKVFFAVVNRPLNKKQKVMPYNYIFLS